MKNLTLPQISHDLRNYIYGISGAVDVIADDINLYAKEQEAQGIQLNSKLKEILEFANVLVPHCKKAFCYLDDILKSEQNDNLTLGELEDCDVVELIKELLIFSERLILEHKVSVAIEAEPNLPVFKCDVPRLQQILINLITNAVKYSSEGSEVKITTKFSNQKLQIEIIDKGIGMTEQEIAMALAGDGTQIDKSNLNKTVPLDSHGLGMPIVKKMVELMKGEMRIESEKGQGTRVILYFLNQ